MNAQRGRAGHSAGRNAAYDGRKGGDAHRRRNAGDDVTTGSESGTDYMVAYLLNEFQRGSFVMRFPTFPSKRELLTELAKYGLSANAIQDVTATPVADVRKHETSYGQAATHTTSHMSAQGSYDMPDTGDLRPSATRPPSPYESTGGAVTAKKPTGCIRGLLTLAVVASVASIFMADNSYQEGQVSGLSVTADTEFGEAVDTCAQALEQRAQDKFDIWGENPSWFTDRMSTSSIHPANAAFMIGCVLN